MVDLYIFLPEFIFQILDALNLNLFSLQPFLAVLYLAMVSGQIYLY